MAIQKINAVMWKAFQYDRGMKANAVVGLVIEDNYLGEEWRHGGRKGLQDSEGKRMEVCTRVRQVVS